MNILRLIIMAVCLTANAWAGDKAPEWQVYFSPKGGCTEAVVNAVARAHNTVLMQAYSFTSAPIAKALVDAENRGVKVQAILDKSQLTERYTAATFLLHAGIPTYIDAQHAIAHNKVMVIDGHVVLTGSFNFTTAAEEHNAENLLVIDDKALAEKYTKNWSNHLEHSDKYEGPLNSDTHETTHRKRK